MRNTLTTLSLFLALSATQALAVDEADTDAQLDSGGSEQAIAPATSPATTESASQPQTTTTQSVEDGNPGDGQERGTASAS